MKYAPDCTRISAEHGFWDEREARSKGEMVKLMITETSEAVEGHRHDQWFRLNDNVAWCIQQLNDHSPKESPADFAMVWIKIFEKQVKNTVEDEMADTVIRVLDYMNGWNKEMHPSEYRKGSTGNFSHDLLRIDWYILNAFHGDRPGMSWNYVLAAIEAFCDWNRIDIEQHVIWKMKYNESRPHKHGKKY